MLKGIYYNKGEYNLEKVMIEFQAYTSFGKGDNTDWEFCYEVTKEEYERLHEASNDGDDFCDVEEIADLYDKIYEAAIDEATRSFIENDPEMVMDYLDEGQSLEEWRADDVYCIEVNFPAEWLEENWEEE